MKHFLFVCQHLLTKPKLCFGVIERKAISAWWPFLTIVFTLLLFWQAYYSTIDHNWLREYTVDLLAGNVSPAEQDQIRQMMPVGPQLKYNAMIGSALVLLLQGLILAAILNLFTKLDERNTDGFKDWFAAIWWTQLPVVPQLLLAIIVLLTMGDNQVLYQDLFITSLNQVLQLQPNNALYAFASAFDLFSIWSYLLLFYLLANRTHLAIQTCLLIAALPLVANLCLSYITS